MEAGRQGTTFLIYWISKIETKNSTSGENISRMTVKSFSDKEN